MRRLLIVSLVAVLAFAAIGCGGGMSTADYADRVETLVVDMLDRLDGLDREYDAATDIADVRYYARERVEARQRMLSALEELEPPDSLKPLHDEAVEIMALLTQAESEMAERVDASDDPITVRELWNTPEGVAASEATMRAFLLCEAAQANFDRTRGAEEFQDMPWIPPAMQNVIDVAFGCHITDRRR